MSRTKSFKAVPYGLVISDWRTDMYFVKPPRGWRFVTGDYKIHGMDFRRGKLQSRVQIYRVVRD